MKQQSSLKEDRFDLIKIATNKILDTFNRKDINTIIKLIKSFFVSKYDQQINFIKFKDLCKAINKSLKADEILKLFHYLDDDESHTISREEFENYLKQNFKRMQTLNLKKSLASKSLLEIEENVCKDIKVSQIEKQIQNELQNFELQDKHYFNNRQTIFTDFQAALKVSINLIQDLSQNQQKYNDNEFGPQQDDEFGEKSIYSNGVTPGGVLPQDIVWLRPEQISQKKTPMFLDSGASANDVIQGQLGDCWLIGALSMLALDDSLIYHDIEIEQIKNKKISNQIAYELISGVYPKVFHFLSKYGIYIFKFFKDCQWLYVMIDDKIPCFSGSLQHPQIIFAKCHSRNEFWVPLIEKAFAKLHGNYNALVGGQLDDALVDMTGRVSEKLKITNNQGKFDIKTYKSPEQFFEKLNQEIINSSMMGCSINQGRNTRGEGKVYIDNEFIGLYSGHAYSLMDVINLGNEKIVRIRNPWGSENPVEWNGPWSDNSPELIKNLQLINKKLHQRWGKEIEELHEENKDGAFLMSFNDFINVWHNISVCKKFPQNFEAVRFFDEWTETNSGGTPTQQTQESMINYAKNFQYIIEVKNQTEIFVSLGQEDGRMKSLGEERFPYENIQHYMSLLIFQLEPNQDQLEMFDGSKLLSQPFLKVNRDIQLSINLNKGKYCIVPATKDENQFGKFHISIYHSCPEDQIKIYESRTKKKGIKIQEESEQQIEFSDQIKKILMEVISIH